jgi:hypothetical protein
MMKILHGKVRGRTIEINDDLGIIDGQEVEIHLRLLPNVAEKPGEGFLRTEGALADDTEWDAIMDEIHESRKVERRPLVSDLEEP